MTVPDWWVGSGPVAGAMSHEPADDQIRKQEQKARDCEERDVGGDGDRCGHVIDSAPREPGR